MQSLQDLIGTLPWPPWELRLVNNIALKGQPSPLIEVEYYILDEK